MARGQVTFVDFETDGIEPRPDYPPKPAGLAWWEPGKQPQYCAWGHPSENGLWELLPGKHKPTLEKIPVKRIKISCDPLTYCKRKARDLWKGRIGFHHAKFDLDVGNTHLDLPIPDWEDYEDTLFSLFLKNPHAKSLSLKPNAKELLGLSTEDQDLVHEWLLQHKVVQPNNRGWGAHIAKAPGNIVAYYACGDVFKTGKLHPFLQKHLAKDVPPEGNRSMLDAYNREKKLLPILLENEKTGLLVDQARLAADIKLFTKERLRVADWLRKRLRAKELNIDSDRELAEALDRAKVVKDWTITGSGQKSVSKQNLLPEHFKDIKVSRALGYHSRLGTAMGTFMEPWLATAQRNKGYIATTWNQVRQTHGGGGNVGARSGRLSCTPNFMNLPKVWDDKGDGYAHPDHIPNLTPLPLCRRYILPDKGQQFGHLDYNQQELRILAHFEGDKLAAAYNENYQARLTNPKVERLDVHGFVQKEIQTISDLSIERRQVKIVNFRTVYGGGATGLAVALKITVQEAKAIINALKSAIPGLRALERALNDQAKGERPIRTWGGRLYYCEPPSYSEKFKRHMTYEYKLLNYLIQGSAADCTKEAVIAYHALKKEGRFLVTVHDEINISAPKGAMKRELARLREAMESQKFDVPMLADSKIGPNWGAIE